MSASMTRQHFNAIANVFAQTITAEQSLGSKDGETRISAIKGIACDMADMLPQFNSFFNRSRFLQAAGATGEHNPEPR